MRCSICNVTDDPSMNGIDQELPLYFVDRYEGDMFIETVCNYCDESIQKCRDGETEFNLEDSKVNSIYKKKETKDSYE